jgi:hypothetical protein
MSTDFSLTVNAKFYTLSRSRAMFIIENGVTGIVGGTVAMGVLQGKLVTFLAGTPNDNSLQTAAIPLNSFTNIEVRRQQGVCSLLVDGATVVATNCTYRPLFPPPSGNNNLRIIGVNGQKTAAASCGTGVNMLSPDGVISSITLTGACTPCPTGTYTSGG